MKLKELELYHYFLPHAIILVRKYVEEKKYEISTLNSLEKNRDCKNNFVKISNEQEIIFIFGNGIFKKIGINEK